MRRKGSPGQEFKKTGMPAQNARRSVGFDGIENTGARENLAGIFFDPSPRSQFQRHRQENVGWARLIVRPVPQIAMQEIAMTLRFEYISVMGIGLFKHGL